MRASKQRVGAAIEPCYPEIGAWLKQERERLGLSQQDVSVMLRLSRPSIANIEAGKQRLLYHQVLEMQEMITEEGVSEYFTSIRTREEDAILRQAEEIKKRRALAGGTDATK